MTTTTEKEEHPNDEPQESTNSSSDRQQRRRKRRWGDATTSSDNATATATAGQQPPATTPADAAKTKALALQESIRKRLEALKKAKLGSTAAATPTPTTTTTSLPGLQAAQAAVAATAAPPTKRAKNFEIDFTVTAPSFQKETEDDTTTAPKTTTTMATAKNDKKHKKQKMEPPKNVNPYLADSSKTNDDNDNDDEVDDYYKVAVRSSKRRTRNKVMNFVEPGTYIQLAEKKRQKAFNAQESGFVSGRKTGQFIQSTGMVSGSDYYGISTTTNEASMLVDELKQQHDFLKDIHALPPCIEIADIMKRTDSSTSAAAIADDNSNMPLIMEWWDMEYLPSKLRKQVSTIEKKNITLKKQKQQQKTHIVQQQLNKKNTTNENDNADADIATNNDNNKEEEIIQQLRILCYEQASLSYSKTAELVQHIPDFDAILKKKKELQEGETNKGGPVLYLTKRELKRQRKLRRQEKQKELQDKQAAGLIPPPEPKLTLKNFIRVLGDQAYLDPSLMEQKVSEQIQKRQTAHQLRNEKNKLTKEQRSLKRKKKYFEPETFESTTHDGGAVGNSKPVQVVIFYVKDISHPYHRAKIDLNAQQNYITGGVIECKNNPSLACIICEGGPKAIKRYIRLMTVRMKWTGTGIDDYDEDEEEEDISNTNSFVATEDNKEGGDSGIMNMNIDTNTTKENGATTNKVIKLHKFNPNNKCELIWQGLATKRLFSKFVFQSCETSQDAYKIFQSKGIPHYWDQVLQYAASIDHNNDNFSSNRSTNDAINNSNAFPMKLSTSVYDHSSDDEGDDSDNDNDDDDNTNNNMDVDDDDKKMPAR